MSVQGGIRKKKTYEVDMTSGALLPKILAFTGPLILTGVLQLLYNAADVVVVGNFAGPQALAAVSSTGALINLLVNLFMGLSVGASVVIARAWGAGEKERIRRAEHTAITLAGLSGLLVGAFGFIMARDLLQLMDSPPDVIDGATLYMKIYFLGMPANMLYNFGAATLRAVGDTRRPLYYLTASGLVNVALNLVLVIVFHLDVAGVAIATVVSQVVSALLVLRCLMTSEGDIRLDPRRLRIDGAELKGILRMGLPAGLQSSLFSISNVLIQTAVNSFGSLIIAGNGVAANLEGFVYTAMSSLYHADLTFASANYGAGKYQRVRRVLWVCLGTVTATGILLGALFYVLGPTLLSFYNSDPAVIEAGMARMSVILPAYFVCGIMDVMVGQLRGIGHAVVPMIVSLTGACLLRIVWILTVFAAYHTQFILYISYPISWIVTFTAHMLCYVILSKKMRTLEKQTKKTPA